YVVIECRDDGIGMSPDLVPRAFDLFVQGQRGLDRRQGGLGLGLAVARTLVVLHGGAIEARSAGADRGSTFVVRLPLAGASAPPDTTRQDRGDASVLHARVGRVMVVDDNRDALETLVEALKQSGIDAFGASTSSEALDLAIRIQPQIAVLD